MGIIKLKTIIYLCYQGITLNATKPFVEANEENLKKLEKYIFSGHLEHVKVDEEKSIVELEEEAIAETIEMDVEPIFVEEEEYVLPERIQEYTEEQLKLMNKAELIEILVEKGIEFKKSSVVSVLENLILSNQ